MSDKLFCPACQAEVQPGDQSHRKLSGVYASSVQSTTGYDYDAGYNVTRTATSFLGKKLAPPSQPDGFDSMISSCGVVVLAYILLNSCGLSFMLITDPESLAVSQIAGVVFGVLTALVSLILGILMVKLIRSNSGKRKRRRRMASSVVLALWNGAYYCHLHDHVWHHPTMLFDCPADELQGYMMDMIVHLRKDLTNEQLENFIVNVRKS